MEVVGIIFFAVLAGFALWGLVLVVAAGMGFPITTRKERERAAAIAAQQAARVQYEQDYARYLAELAEWNRLHGQKAAQG